jgi:hypothetical protein
MTRVAINLTAQQRDLIVDAADNVAPEWHVRFLENVTDELLLLSDIDDDDVHAAINRVLTRLGVR